MKLTMLMIMTMIIIILRGGGVIVLVLASIYHIILSMYGASTLKEIVIVGLRNNNTNLLIA